MIRGGLHGGVIGFFLLASLRRSVLDFIDTPLIYGMNTHGYGHGHRGFLCMFPVERGFACRWHFLWLDTPYLLRYPSQILREYNNPKSLIYSLCYVIVSMLLGNRM
jgi:hypothetical protein